MPKHIGYTKAKGSTDKTNGFVGNDIYEASFPRELHLMTVRFFNRIIPKLQACLKQSIRESREKINMHVYHDRLQVRLAPYWTLLNPTGIYIWIKSGIFPVPGHSVLNSPTILLPNADIPTLIVEIYAAYFSFLHISTFSPTQLCAQNLGECSFFEN